jgi:hypothetical protein
MAHSAPAPLIDGAALSRSEGTSLQAMCNLVLTIVLTLSALALLTWTFAGLLTEIL